MHSPGLASGALSSRPDYRLVTACPAAPSWTPQVTILPPPGFQSGANPSQLEIHWKRAGSLASQVQQPMRTPTAALGRDDRTRTGVLRAPNAAACQTGPHPIVSRWSGLGTLTWEERRSATAALLLPQSLRVGIAGAEPATSGPPDQRSAAELYPVDCPRPGPVSPSPDSAPYRRWNFGGA